MENKDIIKKDEQQKTVSKPSKIEEIKKQRAMAETSKFKAKYFEYYDDIKISDRQDWS